MGRLIDVNDVIKAIDKHTFDTDDGLCLDDDITCILEEVPTIEERKTGKWIHQTKFGRIECDQCGKVYRNAFTPKNYCPNCGARLV